MIATLKQKIEDTYDLRGSFAALCKYCWLTVGLLFVSYLYFVGAITFSVIKEQGMEQDIKTLVSDISRFELQYLSAEKSLTQDFAYSIGLTKASYVSYAAARQAFAWNQK